MSLEKTLTSRSVHVQIGHGDAGICPSRRPVPGSALSPALGQHFAGQRVGHRAAQLSGRISRAAMASFLLNL